MVLVLKHRQKLGHGLESGRPDARLRVLQTLAEHRHEIGLVLLQLFLWQVVLAQELEHVHRQLFALYDWRSVRAWLLQGELLQHLDKLGVRFILAMQLAEDFGLAAEERHWLLHVQQLLEDDFHLPDILHSQLLELSLGLAFVEEKLFEQKTRQCGGI